ncbi:hypothetical protein DM860_000257 [Cuscuta australis]|uniref:F-box domain-containing protein n=1 Tax=Cuscuta australis TaxID=267555 RepID=A0A328D122_9ASTE|nr:hypothetical protein DM860_000257 [Cuscuta australis]
MARSLVPRNPDAMDKICRLPVEIVDHIMGLLSILEAAITASFSKVWRDAWFGLSHLCFDEQFFSLFCKKDPQGSEYVEDYSCSYVITKILLQHKGSIRKFVFLHSGVEALTVKSQSFHMSRWLLQVTRQGVEEIELRFSSKEYKLPNCVFSCSTLTRLHLFSLSIEPLSSPCTLPNVTSLLFDRVCFGTRNVGVRSGTRNLPNYDVHVPKLKDLSFLYCEGVPHFNITAQNLYSLTIMCRYGSYLQSFLTDNLDMLSSICTLELDYSALQGFLQIFPSLNVEQLKLSDFDFQWDGVASTFVCLLCKCPKLCKLEIVFKRVENKSKCIDAESEELKKLRSEARTHQMLSYIKLSSFDGSMLQMHFIQEMLACLPALEKVVITGDPSPVFDWNKKRKTSKKIARFPCASVKAKIVYQ